MKIDGTGKIGPSGEIPEKKKGEKATGDSFASHLDNAMTGKPEKSSAVGPPMPVSSLRPVGKVGAAFTTKAINQLESMLGDLDIYKNSLANIDIPEDQLKPLGDALMKKKDNLVSLLKMVDDPELKAMITDAVTIVLNENSRSRH